jgi:hypothetical protein
MLKGFQEYSKMQENNPPKQKPKILLLDQPESQKIVVHRTVNLATIEAKDKKGQTYSFVSFKLKEPYAKNYRKLAQALLSVNGVIEEQLEIRKA